MALKDSNPFRELPVLKVVLLLIIAACLYWPVMQYGFIDFDDDIYILHDPAIRDLNFSNIKIMLLDPWYGAWQPVTRISHAIDYALFQSDPGGHHLSSIVIHLLSAVVLLKVLVSLANLIYPGRRPHEFLLPAFLSAALFIVHPQHVETVVWIVQRKELLASLFCLLSIAAYLSNRNMMTALFVSLAMLSKPTAVVLPVLFVLLSVAFSNLGQGVTRRLTHSIINCRWLLVLSAIITTLTLLNESGADAIFLDEHFSIINRLLLYSENSLGGLSRFASLQAGMFHQPISDAVTEARLAATLSMIIVVTICGASLILLFLASAPVRVGAAGILFYFISLLPTGGTIIFGNYAFGDRYLYPGSIGLYIVLFLFLTGLLKPDGNQKDRFLTLFLSFGVILAAFWFSYMLLPKWSTTESLWIHDLKRRPDAVFVNHQMGRIHFDHGDNAHAINYFQASMNSKSEPFRIASREASALYSAEIFCDLGEFGKMTGTLDKIESFGGDVSIVESLITSFNFSGYTECFEVLSSWYAQHRRHSQNLPDPIE